MITFAPMYAVNLHHISCPYISSDTNLFWQGVAIVFGVMFGRNTTGLLAYNWYLKADLSGIIFFQPQIGAETVDPGYMGYFGIF